MRRHHHRRCCKGSSLICDACVPTRKKDTYRDVKGERPAESVRHVVQTEDAATVGVGSVDEEDGRAGGGWGGGGEPRALTNELHSFTR